MIFANFVGREHGERVLHAVPDPEKPSSKSNAMAPSAVYRADPIWDKLWDWGRPIGYRPSNPQVNVQFAVGVEPPWMRTVSQNVGEEAWQRRLMSGQAQFFEPNG